MKKSTLLIRYAIVTSLLLVTLGGFGVLGIYLYLNPKLPAIDSLKDVQLQVPLRVYSADGLLIAEYGEIKRIPLEYVQFPTAMTQAVLAAEDSRFFEHPGVDYQGLLRAAAHLLTTGERGQGGSTITMQVARNFFLSRERTFTRKFNEILLSLKIENEMSKEEILSLYLNKIFLGHRAYGVAAAAQVYYGKELAELSLSQIAMIAGLPKAPSTYNPVTNPQRAQLRRDYVLRRMLELNFITAEQFAEASSQPVSAALHGNPTEISAPYLAEMVRDEMIGRYGKEVYTQGLKVYTTIKGPLQAAANQALHNNLMAYEQRHGFRGAERHIQLSEQAGAEEWAAALKELGTVGGLQPALVVGLAEQSAVLYLPDGTLQLLQWEGMQWARHYIDDNTMGPEPESAAEILQVGDIVRLDKHAEGNWLLAQQPQIGGALVSINPQNGAVLALVGGFDFFQSHFNRVTQAVRQPGSSFKPFIYSAALDKGFTAASLINDAPVVFEDSKLEGEWRPENYSGKFYGPTRLREALVNSRNLVSIRLLQSTGIRTAIKHISGFGFDPSQLSRDLSLALGSAAITPYDLSRGYAVFANGGYLIEPHFIERIEDSQGNTLFQVDPPFACEPEACPLRPLPEVAAQDEAPVENTGATDADHLVEEIPGHTEVPQRLRAAPRVAEPRNIYLITTMMQDVIRRGTGRAALQLGRNDLAGKTGTTNDQQDAWFTGFNRDVVTTAWVGFDTPRSMGHRETGARAALPMWIDYMREALKGSSEQIPQQPAGIVSARIDVETGQFTAADNPNAIFELFRVENVPATAGAAPDEKEGGVKNGTLTGELF
ncbi:MAG: penicillin-binding protein 1A [Gammaproteobacteria bacterium]|nr:penicillin-binding protein 1A [Gammaproteobacteria bacterium]